LLRHRRSANASCSPDEVQQNGGWLVGAVLVIPGCPFRGTKRNEARYMM
jgi:hypothetical protein